MPVFNFEYPDELSQKDLMEWSRDDVQTFLRHIKARYDLRNNNMTVLQREGISRRVLMTLTEKVLRADPFNLNYGAVVSFGLLIKSLEATERKAPLQHYIP